jgi:lipopolysaccharide biosynthesis glycosyltransferase
MIAVTIATGLEYRRMAEQAASSIRRHTGLETCVLGSIPQGVRPSFYKLWLFEIFSGTILWFDADTYCLADWSPQYFENHAALVAVPDIPSIAKDEECSLYGLDGASYFNGGMFIANATHHGEVFSLARQLAFNPEYLSVFQEQTALNMAVQKTNTPLALLDRRYNAICAPEFPVPDDPVILHAAGGGPFSPYRAIFDDLLSKWRKDADR